MNRIQFVTILWCMTLLTLLTLGCRERSTATPTVDEPPESMPRKWTSAAEKSIGDDPAAAASRMTARPIDIDGWSRGAIEPLPPKDDGYTAPYQHPSGLGVTLYRYTRRIHPIPDGATSSTVRGEMDRARAEIDGVTRLGFWESAKEIESGTVSLGTSGRDSLWSRYRLTLDGEPLISEIYLWARENVIYKIRCTYPASNADTAAADLRGLLSTLGSLPGDGPDG